MIFPFLDPLRVAPLGATSARACKAHPTRARKLYFTEAEGRRRKEEQECGRGLVLEATWDRGEGSELIVIFAEHR